MRRALGIAAIGLAVQVPVLLNPTHFVDDDPLFYLVIARNVVAGEGSTFNGLVPTNGYHPLWMLVNVGLAAMFPGDTLLLASVGTSVALCIVALVGLDALARRLGLEEATAATGLLALLLTGTTGTGSEMALSAVAHLAWAVAFLAAMGRAGDRTAAACGAAQAFVFLSRLDTVFLVGVALFALALRRPRSAGVAAAVSLALVAPYLAWNLSSFGHLVPISGALKSSFPVPDPTGLSDKLRAFGLLSLAGGAVAIAVGRWERGPRGDLIAVLGGGALLQAAYVALFGRSGTHTHWVWYWVTGMVATALAVAVLFERLRRAALPSLRAPDGLGLAFGAAWLAVAAVGNVSTAFVIPGLHGHRDDTLSPGPSFTLARPRTHVALARSLSARLAPEARLAVWDMPGLFAFYGEHPVVALDALTADFATLDAVEAEGIEAVHRRLGVRCWVLPRYEESHAWIDARVHDGDVTATIRSPRGGDPLLVRRFEARDVRVVAETLVDPPLPLPYFGVWDGPAGPCPLRDPPSPGER